MKSRILRSRLPAVALLVLLAVLITGCERPANTDAPTVPAGTSSEGGLPTFPATFFPTDTPGGGGPPPSGQTPGGTTPQAPTAIATTAVPPIATTVAVPTVATATNVPPPAATTAAPPSPTPRPTTAGGVIEHTVQPGENLYRISLQYGLSWQTVAAFNGITNPNLIVPGQIIRIPSGGASGTPVPVPGGRTHTVQPGENLFRIALQYGMSYTTLAAYNGIAFPYIIYPGQVLRIP
jgi:LysM repeat protein